MFEYFGADFFKIYEALTCCHLWELIDEHEGMEESRFGDTSLLFAWRFVGIF